MDVELINNRLDCVQHMLDHPADADTLRQALRQVPDLDRALSRLALDRAGPRDLVSIRSGLTQAADISIKYNHSTLPVLLGDALKTLIGFDELVALLHDALVDEPPLIIP
jgi:DNA mismatch repair protein MutS